MTTPPTASSVTRFKPTRAGIIGLWDYDDEEFVFADGRLVLRGHNGSGKTKALEVLFPFVLDGSIDPRRLDPFSGEERTMKSNLLYRGQESAFGYVWIEFARTTPDGTVLEAVTCGVGLHASKAKNRPSRLFFVTDGRIGIDFGLLTADGRPLREKQLEQCLGKDAIRNSGLSYRDAIDKRLFGLGPERYAQMVNLLLQLRRPLLAKDLDPDKVAGTLTAGLRPVDEHLVVQAARDFENLAEIQKLIDDLDAADSALSTFLRTYSTYLHTHARHRVDALTARVETAAAQCTELADTAAKQREARMGLEHADEALAKAKEDRAKAAARCDALNEHHLIKEAGDLQQLRNRVHERRSEVQNRQGHLDEATGRLGRLQAEADRVSARLSEKQQAQERITTNLLSVAREAGIASHGERLELSDDLAAEIRAIAEIRTEDVRIVCEALARADKADDERARVQSESDKANEVESQREEAHQAAADVLAKTRNDILEQLRLVVARHTTPGPTSVLLPEDGDTLAAAVSSAEDPDTPSLQDTFRGITDQRRTHARQLVEALQRELQGIAGQLTDARRERDRIAHEKDDAPPESDQRLADRTNRAGAPLWQLVRFGDHVPSDQAAAVEGALYAAGLLTAWLHPDPVATRDALRVGESDAYLVPLPEDQRPADGRTLNDVLVAEEQTDVPKPLINAVLASIRLVDDVVPAIVSNGTTGPQISTTAQFSLGVQAGSYPKPLPEYIGATARAARRRQRLESCNKAIDALETTLGEIGTHFEEAREAAERFDQVRNELPRTASVITCAQGVARAADRLADARARAIADMGRLDQAIAAVHARRDELRRQATTHRLPITSSEIDAVEQAIREFVSLGKELEGIRADIPVIKGDLASRNEIITADTYLLSEQTEELSESKTALAKLAQELATREKALGAPLLEIQRELDEAKRDHSRADREYRTAEAEVMAHKTALAAADTAMGYTRAALATALAEQLRTAAALQPFARPDLLPLLDTPPVDWPPTDLWPDPTELAATLADRLMSARAIDADVDPESVAHEALPAAVGALYTALDAATRGRPATDTALKTTTTNIAKAVNELEHALAATEQGYQLEWESDGEIILARVSDNDGPAPVVQFARHMSEQLADQRVLLEDKERGVLEDGLLGGLAQQIHARTIEARELVDAMDKDTRARPMSSGTTVGIRWIQADHLTDEQRAISRLLVKDAAALGPSGLAELRRLLRGQITAGKSRDRRKSYQQVISDVLDYRSWRTFELLLCRPGEKEEKLTRAKHGVMSGGEKSASIHLPLFAAAHAQYNSAYPTCPRMIALDEAFAGIDEQYRPDLLALTVKFDLDLFMTGHDLWIAYAEVPRISHYDMNYDKASHTVSALLMLWDGEQIHDDLGFPGTDELAADILGFRPTRRAPVRGDDLLDVDADPDSDLDSGHDEDA